MSFRVRIAIASVSAAALGMAGAWTAGAETLDGALARAYVNNPTLNAQRASVRATDELVPQALSGYRPRINAAADAGVQHDVSRTPAGTTDQTYLPRGVSLTVDQ